MPQIHFHLYSCRILVTFCLLSASSELFGASTNLALNPSRVGTPSPLASSPGWGGGQDTWDIVDGLIYYSNWAEGLALWFGGSQQITIDFGNKVSFDKVVIWHHGDCCYTGHNIPANVSITYFDGSWHGVSFQRSYDLSYNPPTGYYGALPDTYSFSPVSGSKVSWSYDGNGPNIFGEYGGWHGWAYEVEVFGADCDISTGITVNQNKLNANQEKWIRYVGTTVIPELVGTRDERIEVAARTTWWSLKEGPLGLGNPNGYSNCDQRQPDGTIKPKVRLKPLEVCNTNIWQVGLASLQVNNFTDAAVSSTITSLWPTKSETDVLTEAIQIAGFSTTSEPGKSIIASNGVLKKSWLLRHPAVGVPLQESIVTAECINGSQPWCYGMGWRESSNFAPTRDAALKSIDDLKCIFNKLAPK